MEQRDSHPSSKTVLIWTFSLALLARFITLDFPGLIDTTEGRYASTAQQMYLSGNWLTPMIYIKGELIPYLGKPPFHFWLTAASFAAFGMNEFAARLPSFLATLLMVGCIYLLSRRFGSKELSFGASTIFVSSGLIFFLAGSCMLDVTLAAMITLALTSFLYFKDEQIPKRKKILGLLFFLFGALGFLTKGPICLVLTGGPIILYSIFTKRVRPLLSLPWITGGIIFILVSLPWFWLNEKANPGFLHYFFINENLERYLIKDYQDRYGSGHVSPYFSSWWYTISALTPWSLIIFLLPWLKLSSLRSWFGSRDHLLFLLCWAVFPSLFFTLGRQVLPGYILPGIPAMALLLAEFFSFVNSTPSNARALKIGLKVILGLGWSVLVTILAAGPFIQAPPLALLIGLTFLALAVWATKIFTENSGNLVLTIASAGLVVTLGLATIVAVADFKASERKSTKLIVQNFRTELAQRKLDPTLGFMFGNPFSIYFYANWDQTQPLAVDLVPIEQAGASSIRSFIVKDNDYVRYPELKTDFEVLGKRGRWYLLTRKGPVGIT